MSTEPRPRQVTISGWVITAASAMLVAAVFDTMTNLRSVDTRESLTKALTTGSAKDLGISVDDALSLIRGALFVAGGAAAVTAVLGVFVLQRHHAARTVLTAAAVPIVVTAPFSGGLLGVVIGVATALLWTQPARDWFAGRPVTQPERARRDVAPPRPTPDDVRRWPPPVAPPVAPPPVAPPVSPPASAPPSALPPPTPSWGQPPASAPVPALTTPVARATLVAESLEVPRAVRLACLLTWVFCAITGGLYALVIVAVGVDRSRMLDLLRDNQSIRDVSLSDSELVGLMVAASALVMVWCLAASMLAVLTWRRQNWARIVLLISIGVSALFAVFAVPFTLLHIAAAVVAFVLLLRPSAQSWFRSEGGSGSATHQAWPPPSGQQPPSYPVTPPERPQGKPPVW